MTATNVWRSKNEIKNGTQRMCKSVTGPSRGLETRIWFPSQGFFGTTRFQLSSSDFVQILCEHFISAVTNTMQCIRKTDILKNFVKICFFSLKTGKLSAELVNLPAPKIYIWSTLCIFFLDRVYKTSLQSKIVLCQSWCNLPLYTYNDDDLRCTTRVSTWNISFLLSTY